MSKILLAYSGVYGQTRKICERIQGELTSRGDQVDVVPLVDPGIDLSRYDAIVIGASIRHGKHNPAVLDFIRANLSVLEAKPSGFFSVSLVARKPAKNTPETNPYVRAFMAKLPWKPRLVGVFAGILDYTKYGFIDRNAIRFIMRLTKGPTDVSKTVEFTNWDDVHAFAGKVADLATGRMS
ncbi:MAG: menaquinone-dependent protoporphyrinogen IX dehydrogenase [Gammaproteobacteria bacterium]|nr:menaquinone-dependent protoporphyrinogen IX dehydrogenase [Gammaproteobacteria bacterium]